MILINVSTRPRRTEEKVSHDDVIQKVNRTITVEIGVGVGICGQKASSEQTDIDKVNNRFVIQFQITADATGAYLHASKIAERDQMRSNAVIADRASRTYYYTMLRSLDRDTVSDEVYANLQQELDENSETMTETSALRRIAQTWLHLDQTGKARDTLAKVVKTCPGYGMMPDLAPLTAQDP